MSTYPSVPLDQGTRFPGPVKSGSENSTPFARVPSHRRIGRRTRFSIASTYSVSSHAKPGNAPNAPATAPIPGDGPLVRLSAAQKIEVESMPPLSWTTADELEESRRRTAVKNVVRNASWHSSVLENCNSVDGGRR